MSNQTIYYLPRSFAKITARDQEIANQVIKDPYQYLLTQKQINLAYGGPVGFTMELFGILAGFAAGSYFNLEINASLRRGKFSLYGLIGIGVFGFLGQRFFRNRAINWFGDRDALTAHFYAYNFVKGNNRYEGRRALKKKPFMY